VLSNDPLAHREKRMRHSLSPGGEERSSTVHEAGSSEGNLRTKEKNLMATLILLD